MTSKGIPCGFQRVDGHQLDGVSLKKCPDLPYPVFASKLRNEQIGCGDVPDLAA